MAKMKVMVLEAIDKLFLFLVVVFVVFCSPKMAPTVTELKMIKGHQQNGYINGK